MAKKVFNMQGGLHSAAAYAALENKMYGSVKATPASFIVSASVAMNAIISTGDGLISVDAFSAKRIQTTTAETVVVPAASASFNRIDSVVAYIDTSVDPVTTVVDNTNDVLKFAVVAGTAAATPAAPTGAAIKSAIGAGNPYMILCNITVPQNAVNLSGATFDNIAPTPLLKSYPIGAVFISVSNTNPQTLFGGKWVAFATGRTLIGRDAGDIDFDTAEETGGAKTHTHPLSDNGASLGVPSGTSGTQNWHWRNTTVPAWNSTHRITMNASTEANNTSRTLAAALTGNTDAGSTLPPYIVTYMWKRTA